MFSQPAKQYLGSLRYR